MRKLAIGITALLYLTTQSGLAETLTTAQDYAVDSDVVLESIVKEIRSVPRDTVDFIGDTVKFVVDEAVTAGNGVAAAFRKDYIGKKERVAATEIANKWETSNEIVFRSYKVSEAVGEELAAGSDAGEGTVLDVSGAFYGVDFPKKTSAFFRPEFNRLFVRQTLSNLFAMEDVLAELHSAERDLLGKQVSIETKFVEINNTDLSELGFDWNFVSKNVASPGNPTPDGGANLFSDWVIPAGQEVFSAGLRGATGAAGAFGASQLLSDTIQFDKLSGSLRWNLVITAIEQNKDTDILSAPSIVTRDGSTATIMVGEERAVSTGFDVKNSESSLYVEHDLEAKDLGVMLEVTPELRSDNLIDLELHPQVIDLIGYDNYNIHTAAGVFATQGGSFGSVVNQFSIPSLDSRMPYYRLREIETQVTVADGSTVGMGGLIYNKLETYKDKVPVIGSIPWVGRLFRSEGEKNVKRNLLIFVTATQVDVNGRKLSDLALKN